MASVRGLSRVIGLALTLIVASTCLGAVVAPAHAAAPGGRAAHTDPFLLVPGDADPQSFVPPGAGRSSDARGPSAEALAPRGVTVQATDPVAFFERADAIGKGWYLGHDNENGQLAWGESFVLDAYLEMYVATRETRYLDRFVTHARSVLAQTDEARRVEDYSGRSGPVWRAGARYGYATLLVTGTDGEPIGYLVAKKNQLNSYTYAEVRPGSARGTFYLRLANSRYVIAEGYDRLVTDRRSRNYWVRRINQRSQLARAATLRAATDRTLAAPMRRRPFDPMFMAHAAHTGLLAYPLAAFARTVAADPSLLPAYGADAAAFRLAAERAVAFHDGEWVADGVYGYYRFAPRSPIWCDGVGIPYNQNLAMGRALLELWRITGEQRYLDRVTRIALHFKRGLIVSHHAGYQWRYWWGKGLSGWSPRTSPSVNTPSYRGFPSWEDIVHAHYDLDFVSDCVAAGVVFTDTDMARLANTLVLTMRQPDDFHNRVNGKTVGGMVRNGLRAARWIPLARVSRDLYDIANSELEEHLLDESPYGAGLYSAAFKASVGAEYAADGARAAYAPRVSILAPPESRVRSWLGVWAAFGPTASSGQVYIDGLRPGGVRATGASSWDVNTGSVADGRRVIEVVARDAVGRAWAGSRRVTVDNTPPRAIWWSAPTIITPNGDGDRDTVRWVFGAREPGGRLVVLVDARGRTVATPMPWRYVSGRDTAASFSGLGDDGSRVRDGRYTVRVFARDRLGNVRSFPRRTLLVSRLAKWRASARKPLTVRGRRRIGLRLARPAFVTAELRRGSRRVAVVRSRSRGRRGLNGIVVSRVTYISRGRGRPSLRRVLPSGYYTLSVTVRDRHGDVVLSRTLRLR